MFKIGKLFHLTHVVDSLRAVDKWYDDVFSGWRFYRGYMKAAGRNASLVAISNCVLEPMQVAPVPGAEKLQVGKFHAKYGQHFHSIAWYVDSVQATADQLNKHEVRMVDMVGRAVTDRVHGLAIWTHPKDSFGALEFAQVEDFTIDGRFHPGWDGAFWRDRHPLQIERTSHVTVVVADLKKAIAFHQEVFGATLIHEEETPSQKKSAFFTFGEDNVVELAQPLSTSSPEARDLEHAGEGAYAVTFKTRDLNRAADFLRSKNQRIEAVGSNSLMINREDSFGIGVGFTNRKIPGDPR
jgi:catechol 2,3-dioxygenase-like lactoylglutathione lyase family enzyme